MKSPVKKWIRSNRLPPIWCPGCGITDSLGCFVNALCESKINQDKTVVISGIGCAGRISGYIDCDSFHTTHGRAIPFAEGVKLANAELNVIVFSGDGDLFAIGTNHFIHAARRNINITVICINNFVYGMTKGQIAPTTPQGSITISSPQGSKQQALNIQALALASGAVYSSRWTAYHRKELTYSMKKAILKKGFSVVEIIA
ncbi:2-oxoacid:ferredoxin oxidoreductase subunit beta, partial [bacterium]|nr:2-oxoacid:ferredoxin oxidoreductase subunit beta [bacterium]